MPDLSELKKKVELYIENLPTIEKPLIIIELDDVARFDPELAECFFDKKYGDDILSLFEDIIMERRESQKKFNINYLPHDLMDFKYIDTLSHEDVGGIFRVNGYVESISATLISTICRFKCPACGANNFEYHNIKTCQFCRQRVSDDDKKLFRKSYREFEFQESYDYRQISESIMCRIYLSSNPEANIFDIQSMLGKRLDMLVKLNIKETKTKGIFVFQIIGIRDAKVKEIDEETKKQIDEFVDQHQQDLLDVLRNNIWYFHKGEDWELKAMLLCAVGLNPEDDELDNHKSKQMIFIWIGEVGLGKTQLMKALSKFIENSGDCGKSSSAVGILGGSQKNQFGQFVFKMGELVRCNNGVLFGDEIGMWNEELLNSLTEQMSDGTITYTKIIKAKHKLFVNYCLSGNPPRGDYDPHKTVIENLGGTKQLNDRATILIITKEKEIEEDEFKKVMAYSVGFKKHEKTLPDQFIRDLIKRTQQRKNPTFDEHTYKIAQDTFIRIGALVPKKGAGYDSDIIVYKKFRVRAWQEFYKSIKSNGRLKNHEKVTEEDIKETWSILWNSSYCKLLEDYGDIDMSTFELSEIAKIKAGNIKPQNKRQLTKWIMEQLMRSDGSPKKLDRNFLHHRVVEEWGINETELEEVLQNLEKNREIILNSRHDEITLL